MIFTKGMRLSEIGSISAPSFDCVHIPSHLLVLVRECAGVWEYVRLNRTENCVVREYLKYGTPEELDNYITLLRDLN